MHNNLKAIRKSQGLTQVQLAEKAGISPSYVTEMENGKKSMNTRRIAQLAKALNVAPSKILEDNYDQNAHHENLSSGKTMNLDLDEISLIAIYRSLSDRAKSVLSIVAEGLEGIERCR